jgi:hypothetical protein
MNLQPIATYFLGEGLSIGYSGNILANWTAAPGNVWTVPLGLGVSKVVKFGKFPAKSASRDSTCQFIRTPSDSSGISNSPSPP